MSQWGAAFRSHVQAKLTYISTAQQDTYCPESFMFCFYHPNFKFCKYETLGSKRWRSHSECINGD